MRLALLLDVYVLGCVDANTNASAPSLASPRHLQGNQSETSIVAVTRDEAPDGPRRLILGYNDSFNLFVDPTVPSPVRRAGSSLMGISLSDDLGLTWDAQDQLTVTGSSFAGDPWLAAWEDPADPTDKVVLYVNLRRDGSATGDRTLAVARSLDAGDSWDFPQVGIGMVGDDGPKVAISKDGNQAVVAYYMPSSETGRFIVLSSPRGSSVGFINDLPIPFQKSGCSSSPDVRPHPAVSAGADGLFYLAARVDHGTAAGCATPNERLEVVRIRNPTSLATAETILSVPVPDMFEGMVLVDPTTSPVSTIPGRTREGVAPSMAVTRTGDGDDALALVMLNPVTVMTGPSAGVDEQNILFVHLPDSDGCVPGPSGCAGATARDLRLELYGDLELDGNDLRRFDLSEDRGGYAYQPFVFAGDSDRTTESGGRTLYDRRLVVGAYLQPNRGLLPMEPPGVEARTYVGVTLSLTGGEPGVFSPFATREFYAANILTVDAGPMYSAVHADLVDEGTWFYPCGNQRTPGLYYFGDYNGGVFPNDYGTTGHLLHVSAWADSRAGCDNVGDEITDFMHVYSGRGEGPF